jgi:hypothetical protein
MPPPTKKKIEHGKRGTYVRGCRCDKCTLANTEYGQNLKDRKRLRKPIQPPMTPISALASVTNIRTSEPPQERTEPGEVEVAVIAEMKALSAASKHPGVVASVIAMARILDNPGAVTTHPSAHRQMTASLDKLWAASVGRKGTLADVAAMTNRSKPSGKASGDK